MTGALDAEMRELASELASELGKTVTLERITETYDPSTGQTTQTVAKSVDWAVTPPEKYALDRIDGSLIHQGDLEIAVPLKGLDLGTPPEPVEGDKVQMDGAQWKIVGIRPVASGDDYALRRLQLRQ